MFKHTIVGVWVLTLGVAAGARGADEAGFADAFDVKKENLSPTGRNDYFILEPNYQLVFEGKPEGKATRLVITVLDKTKKVNGVETRVVEEYETVDGKVEEVSRNYYAIDKATSDVYYFGEDVNEYKDGKVSGHAGSWQDGRGGARYGLFMPARPTVGQKFAQEVAPKVAMDRADVVATDERQATPDGVFTACVKMTETTPLEPDVKETKVYAPRVGLVVDGELLLVKHGLNVEPRPKAPAGAQAAKPPLVAPVAREALSLVGADPDAEAVWAMTINDPSVPAEERKDLIEDLNEDGFADPRNVTPDEMPLVLSRLALIEDLAPGAMDETNAAAFAEAYKDLLNIAAKLSQ